MGSQQRNTWFLRNGWDMKLKLRRGVGCLSERQIRTIIVFRFILGLLHIFLFEHSITVSATPAFGSPAIIKHFQMWKSWNSLFFFLHRNINQRCNRKHKWSACNTQSFRYLGCINTVGWSKSIGPQLCGPSSTSPTPSKWSGNSVLQLRWIFSCSEITTSACHG